MADQLTEEQKEEYRETYKLLIRNTPSKLNSQLLGEVMRRTGLQPTEIELEAMIKEADINKDGLLSFEEFLELMTRKMSHNDADELVKEAFRSYDRDGDGYIDKGELLSFMRDVNDSVTEEEVDTMIKEADYDNDGKVSFEEFYRIIT